MRDDLPSMEAKSKRFQGGLLWKIVTFLVVGVVVLLSRECAREVGNRLVGKDVKRVDWAERSLLESTARAELPCELVPSTFGHEVPVGIEVYPSGCQDDDLYLTAALIRAKSYNLEQGVRGVVKSVEAEARNQGAVGFTSQQSPTEVSGLPAEHISGSFRVRGARVFFEALVVSNGKDGWMIQATYPDSSSGDRRADVEMIFRSLRLLELGSTLNPAARADG